MAFKLFIDHDVRGMRIKSKDVVFKVYRDGRKFGELRLSQGAVVWRGRKDKFGRKMRWVKFDTVMQEEARLAERRRPGTRTGVRKQKRI